MTKYLTTLTLTALSSLLLVFSAQSATAQSKSPHGLFQIGPDSNAWSNPLVDGVRLDIRWSDIQPDDANQFDWSAIDAQLANANASQKQLGISLVILSAAPKWLTNLPGVDTYHFSAADGSVTQMVLPWDPIVQSALVNFITQLCQRYDGLVDYIVMGGMGVTTETQMPDPDQIGLNLTVDDAIAAWTDSANTIIDAYAAHLNSTPFIMAAAVPFSTDATGALQDVIDRATSLYDRFGIMNCELSARGTAGSLPMALIAQYSGTNPVGFQLLCPVAGGSDGQTLGGTLHDALNAGVLLGARWIEIYGEDATPDNAAVIEDTQTQLTAALTLPDPPPPADSPPPADPSATKAPHGMYEIGGDAWTNPNISGWKGEILWSASNSGDNTYDWSKIDGLVSNAVKYHKQLGVSIRLLCSVPTWVKSLPGVKIYRTPLGPDPMVLPWDPVAQPKIIAYIKAFCQHFDGKLDFVVMGGLGYKTETYMPLPSDIGLNMSITDYTNAWVNACDLFIDTYSQNLHTTPFIVAGGNPFNDPGSIPAEDSIINHGLLYPLFGLTQWGLNARSNSGWFMNALIQENDAGRATGFQLIGASDGSVGGPLNGTLAQAFAAGLTLGADWIEVYAVDGMNPVYAALLAQYNVLLK